MLPAFAKTDLRTVTTQVVDVFFMLKKDVYSVEIINRGVTNHLYFSYSYGNEANGMCNE